MRRLALVVLVPALLWPGTAAAGGGFVVKCPGDLGTPPERTVFVADNCFRKKVLEIEAGEVVRWQLRAAQAPHTVSFDNGLDTGDLGGELAVQFNEPGKYEYFCRYHGAIGVGMSGTVLVQGKHGNFIGASLDVVEAPPGLFGVDEGIDAAPVATGPSEVSVRVGLGTAASGLLIAFGLAIGAGAALTGRVVALRHARSQR